MFLISKSSKIKKIEINTSYGEEVCCIKCHRVNIIVGCNFGISKKNFIDDSLKNSITTYCYNCCYVINPGNIIFYYRKRRNKWVLIPPEWKGVGPTKPTIRERKAWAKEKHTKIKSQHGKIISKAQFRLIDNDNF